MESLAYPVAILMVVLNNALPAFGIDYCYMYSSYNYFYLAYCSDTCCGSYASTRYCCYTYYSYYYSASVSVGGIIGAVIGGLIGLAILVAFLVIICKACNKNTQRGAVVTAAPTHVSTVSSTVQYQAQPTVGFNHAPAYGQPVYGQPAYMQPAYPPSYGVPPPPANYPAPQQPGSSMPPPTYAENIVNGQPPEETKQ